MTNAKWSFALAARDVVEIIATLGFIIVAAPLLERLMTASGLSVTGSSRILATGILFVLWALLAMMLLRLNREPLSAVGLDRPRSFWVTIGLGLALALALFSAVVALETLGYGRDRLGEMARELKGDHLLLMERTALSIMVVGFVEEFIFRGFLMTRLASLFGNSAVAWGSAVVVQALLFGLSHGYQGAYGMALTASFGLIFALAYLAAGRNLWIPIVGHGVYDATHALYLGLA